MKIVVRTVIIIIVILGQLVRYLYTQADRSLVSPAAGHILDGVAAATQNQKRQIPTLDELNTLCVALDRTIVRAQLVIGKRVGTTLDHNRIWSEPHPHFFHYCHVDLSERVVVNSSSQWYVQAVVLTLTDSSFFDVASPREKVPIPVE